MNQMHTLIRQIPFFSGKRYTILPNLYLDDPYPACLLVRVGTGTYKVRFPGVLNQKSVQSEATAIRLLAEHGVTGIPRIVTEGIVEDTPYLIENYIKGSSLDKSHSTLSREDWAIIAHSLAHFLQEFTVIKSSKPYVLKKPETRYDNYGEVVRESILKHLHNHTSSGLISSATAKRIVDLTGDIVSVFHGDAIFLHFDIKPQNIIFDPQSKRVALIDYEHARMGDQTHELFRADMAAMRYPYFSECWAAAKQEFLNRNEDICEPEYSGKLFYYELFFDLSEMTYSVLTGNRRQISAHLNRMETKLR